jgi:hypothetical protein
MFILDSIVLLSLFSITLSFSLTAQKTCVKNSFTIKRECLFSSPSDDSLFSGPRNDKTFGPSCVIVAGTYLFMHIEHICIRIETCIYI